MFKCRLFIIQMAESKKQESSHQSTERRQRDESPTTNPFANYVSQKEEEGQVGGRDKRRPRSPSSQKGEDRQSRSRSREKQARQFKDEPRPPRRFDDNDYYYRRDRERDRGYMYNQRPRRDEGQDHSHYKTRICPLFQKGQCKRGEACNFAHGEKEIRGLPNFKKTRLCIPFKNGECPRSSNQCNYAHGQAQLKKLAYDYFPQKHQGPYQQHYRPERPYRDEPYRQRDSYRGRGGERDRRGRYDGPRDYPSKDNPPNYPPHGYGGYMPPYSTFVVQKDNSYMYGPPPVGPYGQGGQMYPPPTGSLGTGNPPTSYGGSTNAPPPPPYPYGPVGSYEYNYGYFGQNYGGFNSSSSSV